MRKNYKVKLIITVLILCIFGIIMVYTSSDIWSKYKYGNSYHYVLNQSIFLSLGIIIMGITSKIDYKVYYKNANKILFIVTGLLILVLIPGIGKIRNGSRSWFGIGPFGMQPSELAKTGLIIFTSKYLSKNNKEMDTKYGLVPILIIILFAFGLIMLEPDFGSGMIMTLTLIGMIFISPTKLSFFVKIGILGVFGITILILIAPYRLSRILSFINPWSDPLGSGFQTIQSLYAIGPSGLLGMGFNKSIQKYFYLPEPETDFIFGIVCEEFGFLGAIFVVSLFFILFYICMKIFFKTEDLFAKYLVFGLSFEILLQGLLNLCVVTGLAPITGVTLPFISYGGSSLIISMINIGIILNIENSNTKSSV